MVQFTLAMVSPFLTEAVIDKVFKRKTATQDTVKKWEITRAAPAGSGLLGAVYRIKVIGNVHVASFVLKAMVQDPFLKKSLESEKYFKREVMFFSEVLPTLIQVQNSCGAKERIQNSVPICYEYYCDGENDFFIMEDLCESHCVPVPEYPTKSEKNSILKTLAHLHATSMAVRLKKPELFAKIASSLHEVYYSENTRVWYSSYLQKAIEIDLKALSEYEDPSSVYYKKFLRLVTSDPYGQMIKLVTDQSDYPTINHGDAWTPNFLYSKDRFVAIDFQLTRCASPAIDLAYFMILSSNQIRNAYDALETIKIYHNSLTYYLKDMSIDANEVFSWEALNNELNKYGKFGILAALTTFPLLVSERCDVLQEFENKYKGVDRIPLEDLWRLRPFKTDQEKMILVHAVRLAVNLGFI